MATQLCRHCEQRKPDYETAVAQRKRGGAYNRAPRFYPTRICADCARDLLEGLTPGHLTVAQWGKHGLKLALEKIERQRALHAAVEAQRAAKKRGT